jgi:membrane protease YdiL (CAAX protease family)
MTILAWLISRMFGHSELRPQVAWAAIVMASLAFGAIHLPQLAAAAAATPIGIAATILGNSLVGVVCGWLYWQRGLVAAILAHLSVDLVLHVVPALFV